MDSKTEALLAELRELAGDNEKAIKALAEFERNVIKLHLEINRLKQKEIIHYVAMAAHILYEILKHN
jgi:hypothetical protein